MYRKSGVGGGGGGGGGGGEVLAFARGGSKGRVGKKYMMLRVP